VRIPSAPANRNPVESIAALPAKAQEKRLSWIVIADIPSVPVISNSDCFSNFAIRGFGEIQAGHLT
jgi:hypothetical protein